MQSEKYAARRGSMEDGMHMITACFARASQGCTSRTYMHFLLIFQEVLPISKTRNQLHVKKLKDLQNKRDKSFFDKMMIARSRKTMVLCVKCHHDLHNGTLGLKNA